MSTQRRRTIWIPHPWKVAVGGGALTALLMLVDLAASGAPTAFHLLVNLVLPAVILLAGLADRRKQQNNQPFTIGWLWLVLGGSLLFVIGGGLFLLASFELYSWGDIARLIAALTIVASGIAVRAHKNTRQPAPF